MHPIRVHAALAACVLFACGDAERAPEPMAVAATSGSASPAPVTASGLISDPASGERVTCDYENTNDRVAQFGESTLDEMCFFIGFAVGDPPLADCPNLWEPILSQLPR